MISFQPSEDQEMIRDMVGQFAREQIRPLGREADESGVIPTDLIQQGWDLGLVSNAVPETHGGGGERSCLTGALIAEELAYGNLSIAVHLLAPRLLVLPVAELGTPEQQAALLPAYTGSAFRPATAAIVEPRFDFDTASIATTARRDAGGFVLDGEKCFVPLAADAESLLIYARVADEPGLAAFLVDRGAPGLTITEREKNMGLKGLATYELRLDGCRVGANRRLAGSSAADLERLVDRSRVALAALAIGVARAAYDYARDYAKERRAFGVAIAQKQAIAFMLAEMALEIDAARLLTWEAA